MRRRRRFPETPGDSPSTGRRRTIATTLLIAVVATFCLAAHPAVARATDPPVHAPPTLAEIVAAVRAREERTFPRSFDTRCTESSGGTAAASTSWSERVWIGCVLTLRRTFHAGERPFETLAAHDGTRSVLATRELPEGRWSGQTRLGPAAVLQGSALAAFFTVGTSRLSDSLENGRGRVHGWTTVGDRRCVLVEVVDRADLQVALGLDPAAQFLPVAVWSVLPPAAEPTNLRPSPSWVRVPYQTADGSSGDLVRRLLRKYTATSIGVLGETRAPFPSGIEADLDRLGGVRLSVTVEASADREDETPFGASGAGLARLLPGSGSLSDTDASQVIEFGTGGPPRGADGAAAPDRNAGTLPPTHPADDESSLVTWLLLGILAALASATVWRLLAALRHAPPRKGAHE